MSNKEIKFEFPDDTKPEDLVRIQQTIHQMLAEGVFSIKNGRVILHFDHLGILQIVAFDFIKWRRKSSL
jgi:hypothetical protein